MIKARDIHVIQKDSRYVVFHPESLGLFSVTEDIGKMLKSYEINSKYIHSEIERYINTLLNHISENIVPDSAKDLKWENSETRTLNLLISQDCNLRCGYCYADHGTYKSEKKLMSYDTAKKCIDKFFSKESDNHIVFFEESPF